MCVEETLFHTDNVEVRVMQCLLSNVCRHELCEIQNGVFRKCVVFYSDE